MKLKWHHKSVVKLQEEYGMQYGKDPIEIIRSLSRDLVLKAFTKGWNGPPYDIIELARILGMDVMPNDMVIDARIISQSRSKYLIEYNPLQKPVRINFSLAHEIGHSLFSDCSETIRNRAKSLEDSSWELEFLCNIAAAEILLPYAKFNKDANSIPLTLDGLIYLANKYNASLEAVFIRFCEVVDKPCMVLLTQFNDKNELELQYSLRSQTSTLEDVADGFVIPKNSKAYECLKAGWTSHHMEAWKLFKGEKYRVFSIGLPPIRKHTSPRVGIFIVPEHLDVAELSKIYMVNGDATEPRGTGNKIIAQVVNTSAGAGFGFGRAMSTKYPSSKKALSEWKEKKSSFKLGSSQLVKLSDNLWVFQMIAQEGIFPKYGQIPLKYDSLRKGLEELSMEARSLNATVHMPLIGAGQAKGDWGIIEGIIHQELIRNGVEVTVYVLPGSKADKEKISPLDLFNSN
jgi:Zn-dependent peptidase ImmA (M78 family)